MSRAEVPPSAYRERGRLAPKLSFEDAIQTLQSMFQGWTRVALTDMLQANNLNMELTIESILAIGAPPDRFGGHSNTSSGLPDMMIDATPDDSKRGHPVVLPDDFLRVPGASKAQQMEADEQLARMLQDELFLRELRDNPEFQRYTARPNSANPGYPAYSGGANGG